MHDTKYAFTKKVEGTVAEVDPRVRAALAAEGFGVLTEIDVKATLKKKLDVDRKPYVILGACSPPDAHRALEAEPSIGVLLPCNVTVFEGEDGATYVQAINPDTVFGLIDNPEVQPLAREIGARLQRVLDAV